MEAHKQDDNALDTRTREALVALVTSGRWVEFITERGRPAVVTYTLSSIDGRDCWDAKREMEVETTVGRFTGSRASLRGENLYGSLCFLLKAIDEDVKVSVSSITCPFCNVGIGCEHYIARALVDTIVYAAHRDDIQLCERCDQDTLVTIDECTHCGRSPVIDYRAPSTEVD